MPEEEEEVSNEKEIDADAIVEALGGDDLHVDDEEHHATSHGHVEDEFDDFVDTNFIDDDKHW
jgi:hypothetical protein